MANGTLPKTTKWKNRRDAALAYTDHGIKVFPVFAVLSGGQCACGKSGCASPGKHPMTPHGHKDACAAKEFVNEYWHTNSVEPNIGMVTGVETGLVVLDSDVRDGKDGMVSLKAQGHDKEQLSATRFGRSQSGGYHFFFRSENPGLKSKTALFDGVDVKANGGSVILPPSVGPNGEYKYENDVEAQPLPDWLLGAVTKSEASTPEYSQVKGMPIKVPKGMRNNTLFQYCRALRAKRLAEDEILSLALSSNTTYLPPMEDIEVENIVKSAMSYAPQFPNTHEGFADRFVHEYRHAIRHDPVSEQWYVFDEVTGLWKPSEREVLKRANHMFRSLIKAATD